MKNLIHKLCMFHFTLFAIDVYALFRWFEAIIYISNLKGVDANGATAILLYIPLFSGYFAFKHYILARVIVNKQYKIIHSVFTFLLLTPIAFILISVNPESVILISILFSISIVVLAYGHFLWYKEIDIQHKK